MNHERPLNFPASDLESFPWPGGTVLDFHFSLGHEFELEKYDVVAVRTSEGEGTWVIRARDKKHVLVSRQAEPVAPVVEEGLLATGQPHGPRRVDLRAFDLEATFEPRGRGVVTNSDDATILAIDEVDRLFEDLNPHREEGPAVFTPSDQRIVEQLRANLRRPQRASTVILGAAGTGKTTLVKAALRDLPRTWRVKVLSSTALEAGARFTGMFGQRVEAIIAASEAYPIVWFADEIHTLKGSGAHSENPNDLFEKLKGPLADGRVRIVGTDTSAEYFATVRDPAVLRRFTTLELPPPTPRELRAKLRLWVSDSCFPPVDARLLEHVIETAADFNATEHEPSRSVALLEAAFARLVTDEVRFPVLTREAVDRAAGVLYRLDPAIRDVSVLRERLRLAREVLDARVIGQDRIKEQLILHSRIALANLHDGGGPRLSAFLAGAAGAGKSEVASAYAEAMGLPARVIEMSRFSEGGRDGEDLLAEIGQQLRAHAFSVLVLDQVEKAQPRVLETIGRFLSEDEFTAFELGPNGRGRSLRISAKNATVLLVSNAGAAEMKRYFAALPKGERDLPRRGLISHFTREWIKQQALAEGIPEALLDRVKVAACAYPPTSEELRQIVKLHFAKMRENTLGKLKVRIDYFHFGELTDWLVRKSREQNLSNRDVLNGLRSFVNDRSSAVLLHDETKSIGHFAVSLDPRKTREQAVKPRRASETKPSLH